MKKILVTAIAVLIIVIGAFAAENNTSIWGDMKKAASSLVTDVSDINITKSLIKTKEFLEDTKKATRNKLFEMDHTEIVDLLDDIWKKGVIIEDQESLFKISESFNQLIKQVENEPEKKELVLYRMNQFVLKNQ